MVSYGTPNAFGSLPGSIITKTSFHKMVSNFVVKWHSPDQDIAIRYPRIESGGN
ncbi:hypothetical protein Curi_c16480 [Gottschalkia acidurici 9a]|uniref:Uncharacterized protein n=1 Tax=Gottschalkia acidurici (strain ATCC 7906 / DSM 604 / BCRC 14475 / CIP 104303 / KCTC 5404 / NCIMB 10678 / 9a) TaxID=1128398 RepID=K0B134_GOTA9|nr:hypothetical protein [Gottschalkia acidurici]AFS78655.1 hypothetical protein Curi_c16480 [Gottschalkia acidurici 9a]